MQSKLHTAVGAIASIAGLGTAGQFAANATGASGGAADKLWIGAALCLLVAFVFGVMWWLTRPANPIDGAAQLTTGQGPVSASAEISESPGSQVLAATGVASPVAEVQGSPGATVHQIGRDQHNYLGPASPAPQPPPSVIAYSHLGQGLVQVTNNGSKDNFSIKVTKFMTAGNGGVCEPVWSDTQQRVREIRRNDDAQAVLMKLEPNPRIISWKYKHRSAVENAKDEAYLRRRSANRVQILFLPAGLIEVPIGSLFSFCLTVNRDSEEPMSVNVTYGAIDFDSLLFHCDQSQLDSAVMDAADRRAASTASMMEQVRLLQSITVDEPET